MSVNTEAFIRAIKQADATIQTELVFAGGQPTSYETWIQFNKYDSVLHYGTALNKLLKLAYKEISAQLRIKATKLDALEYLEGIKQQFSELHLTVYSKEVEERTLYNHAHFSSKNVSSEEIYRDNMPGISDVQDYLEACFKIVALAVTQVNNLINIVQSTKFSLTPQVISQTSIDKIKVNISMGHIAALASILNEAGVFEQDTIMERIFELINHSFETKKAGSKSTQYLRKIFDKPSENHFTYWKSIFAHLLSTVKTLENKARA